VSAHATGVSNSDGAVRSALATSAAVVGAYRRRPQVPTATASRRDGRSSAVDEHVASVVGMDGDDAGAAT